MGQEIWLVTEDDTQYSGTLLSGAGDIILQRGDGSVTVIKLDGVREFNFPELPEGLMTKPTLVWMLESDQAGDHETELTYLTEGINWEADYIVVLAQDDASLDLDGNGYIDAEFNPAEPAVTNPDPQCVGKPWKDKEKANSSGFYGCGLGAELALFLPPLMWLSLRRRRSLP